MHTETISSDNSSELRRVLASRHVSMISFGGIIGAGLFVGSSVTIAAAGPAIVLSYLIAGAMVLLVMRMLGEMAVALPHIRSFSDFARVGLGEWAGFVVGWLYWYFWVIVVPVEAIAGAQLLQLWIAVPAWVLGVVLMAVMTGVNLMSARSYGEFEFWFSLIKVSAIIAFILTALAWAFGLTSGGAPTWSNLVSGGGFAPKGPLAVLAAVTSVFFAIVGAEITVVAAAESREPVRAVARMSTTVITRIMVFYVGSIFLIVTVVPWQQIVPGKSPFTAAMMAMHFRWASVAMTFIILTAVLSCLNSAFYVTSRTLFALAARGDAPKSLVKLNRRGVPVRSVLMGSVAGLAGIAAATMSPQGVFKFLVNASGALVVVIYLLVAFAQVKLRRARSKADQRALPVQMWLYPVASYAAIAGMFIVLFAMASTPSMRADFYASALSVAVALIAAALHGRRRVAAAR
jgi:L-asparagine transporter-like permease